MSDDPDKVLPTDLTLREADEVHSHLIDGTCVFGDFAVMPFALLVLSVYIEEVDTPRWQPASARGFSAMRPLTPQSGREPSGAVFRFVWVEDIDTQPTTLFGRGLRQADAGRKGENGTCRELGHVRRTVQFVKILADAVVVDEAAQTVGDHGDRFRKL